MLYIESPSNDAYFNMALEEYVFEGLARSEEYFMLWQNQNAIVVGKYQNTAEEINQPYVSAHGVQVVRRLSGGGAMYQDMGNLNFTFVVNQAAARPLDFDVFTGPVAGALRALGVPCEASGRNDITIEGRKFSGNAQYNKKGRTMHHGTLLFASRLDAVAQALRVSQDKIESKAVKSVRSRVANISDWLPPGVSLERFKAMLLEGMFPGGAPPRYTLTQQDLAAVQRLREEKYATWGWTFGRNPAFSLRRHRRYPFGGVTLEAEVAEGRIEQLRLTGDFFGNEELAGLYARLQGCPLRPEAIAKALAGADMPAYIRGMSTEAFIALLCSGEPGTNA